MAALQGRHGLVKWKTKQIFRADHWDLSLDVDMLDVSAFSTDGKQWRDFLPGLSQWSGTISGFQDVIGDSSGQKAIQTAILTPATGTVKLFLSETGGENLYGSVYFRNESLNVDVADSEKMVFGFQGTGTLTYSTTG
jgi:hypothetical protein